MTVQNIQRSSRLVRRPAFYSLVIAVILIVMTANAPVPLYPIWEKQMGFGSDTVGTIFACYNVGVLISLMTCGTLADDYGPRVVLLPAIASAVIADLLFGIASGPALIEVARFFIGLAAGAFFSAGTAAVIRAGHARGNPFPALFASIGTVLGFGLGPLVAGALVQFAPWPLHLVFGVLGILLCLMGGLLSIWLPQGSHVEAIGRRGIQLPSLPREGRGIMVSAMLIFAGPLGASALFISLGPSMIASSLHNNSPLLAGAVSFLVFGAGCLCQVVLRKYSPMLAAKLGLPLTLLALIVVVAAQSCSSVSLFILSALIMGFGQSLSQYAAMQLLNATAPKAKLASISATFFLAGYVFGGGSVLLLGYASNGLGLLGGSLVFSTLCALVVLGGAFGLFRFVGRSVRD